MYVLSNEQQFYICSTTQSKLDPINVPSPSNISISIARTWSCNILYNTNYNNLDNDKSKKVTQQVCVYRKN